MPFKHGIFLFHTALFWEKVLRRLRHGYFSTKGQREELMWKREGGTHVWMEATAGTSDIKLEIELTYKPVESFLGTHPKGLISHYKATRIPIFTDTLF